MRIGILTLTLHNNYGGILQAYALQTVLERMGHKVEVFNRPFTLKKTKWQEIPKRIVKKILGKDVVIFKERKYNREAPVLNKAIWEFRKEYIHERVINSLHDIKEYDYDCIIVGSDQVWRPRYFKSQWNTGIEDAFLAFTKGWNIKRIAYACSFGVDTWEYTEEETLKCKEAIKMFDLISVRENSGINILNNYFGVDNAVQGIDPTLLLDQDDYKELFKKAHTPKSNGDLLVYMLDINKDKRMLVNRITKERGLMSFSVNKTMVKKNSPVEDRILPSIETWLRGFYDAEMVVTDSFHACVFSIIWGKPFVALVNVQRGGCRFDSLSQSLELKNNVIYNTADYNIFTDYSIFKESVDLLSLFKNKTIKMLSTNICID